MLSEKANSRQMTITQSYSYVESEKKIFHGKNIMVASMQVMAQCPCYPWETWLEFQASGSIWAAVGICRVKQQVKSVLLSPSPIYTSVSRSSFCHSAFPINKRIDKQNLNTLHWWLPEAEERRERCQMVDQWVLGQSQKKFCSRNTQLSSYRC